MMIFTLQFQGSLCIQSSCLVSLLYYFYYREFQRHLSVTASEYSSCAGHNAGYFHTGSQIYNSRTAKTNSR
jgi:hypothetical protein